MRRGALAAVVAAAALVVFGPVATATAEDGVPSRIQFVDASPVLVAFGENWVVEVNAQVVYLDGEFPLGDATVAAYLDGATEPFVTGIPTQPDGTAYLTQPSAQPLLTPGQHQLTAVVTPPAGSGVAASTTATPLVIQVAAYAISASISVDGSDPKQPVIVTELTGEYVDETGGVPPGTWSFVVTSGTDTILDAEAAQPGGDAEPVMYPISGLTPGADYNVAAEFAPVDAIAAGLEVTQPTAVDTRAAGGDFDLGAAVPYPLWALLLTILPIVGLVVTVIVLQVRASRRSVAVAAAGPVVAESAAEPVVAAAEPSWDPFATAGPAETLPPTQVLPHEPGVFTQLITPTPPVTPPQDAPTENWSLSDDPDQNGQHLR